MENKDYDVPLILTKEELDRIVDAFVKIPERYAFTEEELNKIYELQENKVDFSNPL